jgi:hypothetical protein
MSFAAVCELEEGDRYVLQMVMVPGAAVVPQHMLRQSAA